MTYGKFRPEFDDECAAAGLSDTAHRVHSEAIRYLYRTEDASCLILKAAIGRFATSRHRGRGIAQLVAVGFWKDHGDCWEVVHHAEFVRKSLGDLEAYRVRNRLHQAAWRDRQEGVPGPDQDQTRIQPGARQAQPQSDEQGLLRDVSSYPHTTPSTGTSTGRTRARARARGEP
jgi:hypothetical protein